MKGSWWVVAGTAGMAVSGNMVTVIGSDVITVPAEVNTGRVRSACDRG